MRKKCSNLLKIMVILITPGLAYTAYAQNSTSMNQYCATHRTSHAQQKCAKYFQGYWYENENYYDDGPYNDEVPYNYYPNSYYYPYYPYNYYPYYPKNMVIENEENE